MSDTYHVVLYLFLFILFPIWGVLFSRSNNKYLYWLYALAPIIVFAFIVGSRYGWGPDYISYKERFEHAFSVPEAQIGFRILNQGILGLGFNYVGCYIIYSLIFIICAFKLIRSYQKESVYMYAFVVPATLEFITTAIRQGIAFSFVLLSLYFFDKKKWIAAILCVTIGYSIHSAILITVVMIFAIFLIFKKPISWKISIPFYVFFAFIYDVHNTAFLSSFLQNINLGNDFQSYFDHSDDWFGDNAVNEIYMQSGFALIMSSLFYVSVIYIGYKALERRFSFKIVYLYNSMVVGIVLYRAVFLFEILRRLAEPLVMLYFLVLGYSIYAIRGDRNNDVNVIKSSNPIGGYRVCLFFISAYLISFWGRFVFLNENSLFFWNMK